MDSHTPDRALRADYRPEHRSLLVDVSAFDAPAHDTRVGGLVLPVSRSFAQKSPGLVLAMDLAISRDCRLVILCSKRARVQDFPAQWRRRLGARLVLVDHDELHPDWKADLPSDRHAITRYHRANDAAGKRNAGLVLAVRLGWRWALFLDDDVFPDPTGPTLDPAGLDRALAALQARPELQAVGWSARGMEDHSVIGHARKLLGLPQDVFVGSGAMLTRIDVDMPFFPNIYNHDWVFLFAMAQRTPSPWTALGYAGDVRQVSYEPYLPARGRSEEVGDLIGECLLNLLEDHGRRWEVQATVEFWREAIRWRRILIKRLSAAAGERLIDAVEGKHELLKAQQALHAANLVAHSLAPQDLDRYLWALKADQLSWRGQLSALRHEGLSWAEGEQVVADFGDGKPPTPVPVEAGGQAYGSRPC